MTNIEILSIIKDNIDKLDLSLRIITRYSSNEGAQISRFSISWLDELKIDSNQTEILEAIVECKSELSKAINLNEKFVNNPSSVLTGVAASPIAAFHALEKFYTTVVDKISL